MDHKIRLAACDIIKTRFQGRAALRRDAARCPVALAKLELCLGLGTAEAVDAAQDEVVVRRLRAMVPSGPSWSDLLPPRKAEALGLLLAPAADRRTVAARRYAALQCPLRRDIHRAVAPLECQLIDEIRAARAARPVDPLADRAPGHAARVIAPRRAAELVEAAGFREARHGHETRFVTVEVGAEGAESETETDWPNQLGINLPKAYKYKVTTSYHAFHVSPAILTPEVRALNAAAPKGIVYLSTHVRVRQGRGTSLVVERLTPRQALRALREAA